MPCPFLTLHGGSVLKEPSACEEENRELQEKSPTLAEIQESLPIADIEDNKL